MNALARFRQIGIAEAARRLELHPFELVRILVSDGSLPERLTLSAEDLDRVSDAGGLEVWWVQPVQPAEGEGEDRAMVRSLLRRLLDGEVIEPKSTRADNLFRGLESERQRRLRRAVNGLIQHGCLFSQMSATGLVVGLRAGQVDDVRLFAVDGEGPVDRLWDVD